MGMSYIYKNAKIERAINGYIVCYDKYMSKGEYDGSSYVGECKQVFKDGKSAIEALDNITSMPEYVPNVEVAAESMSE